MTDVTTVLGEVGADTLGRVSMHEHVFCDATLYARRLDRPVSDEPVTLANLAAVRADHSAYLDNLRLDSPETARAELAAFAEVGGGALLELTVPGSRERAEQIRAVSAASGVKVIASTGLYIEEDWPERFHAADEAAFYDFMMGEIADGIDGSDVRAGHIGELGINDMSHVQQELLRAAVRASRDSGLSVSVHISDPRDPKSRSGVDVARFLVDAGCDPSRTIINHVDYTMIDPRLESLAPGGGGRRPDYDYARTILELGFCVTVDSFGWEHYNPLLGWTPIHDWERMDIVRQLVAEGYGDRVMLGTDSVLKHLQWSHGGTGYRNLLANVVPGLRRMGVEEQAIEALLVHNPARLLARQPV